MGTTPTYSWPYPESTGLVKDGWEDIKDLATAIDTTASASFGGSFVKISSTTVGSAVSSVSVDSCFSSTYKNYRIIYNLPSFSVAGNFNLRMRVSGSDNSSSNYKYSALNSNSTSPWWDGTVSSSATQLVFHRYTRTDGIDGYIDIFNPFATAYTSLIANGVNPNFNYSDGSTTVGSLTVNTSYTGFTFFPTSGTMTGGTIKVYGFKD